MGQGQQGQVHCGWVKVSRVKVTGPKYVRVKVTVGQMVKIAFEKNFHYITKLTYGDLEPLSLSLIYLELCHGQFNIKFGPC